MEQYKQWRVPPFAELVSRPLSIGTLRTLRSLHTCIRATVGNKVAVRIRRCRVDIARSEVSPRVSENNRRDGDAAGT